MTQPRKNKSKKRSPAARKKFTHGGARPGAGRPRKEGSLSVAHGRRQRFSGSHPIHVTIRMVPQMRSLRTRKKYKVLHDVFCNTRRQGFRVCHFSVQDDHIHLIVEAKSRTVMSAGMRSVNIRIGLGMNALLGRESGRVIGDRYQEVVLNSPREVHIALAYVLNNRRRHVWKESAKKCERDWLDPFSSSQFFDGWKGATKAPEPLTDDSPVEAPRTLLLKKLWRKHRLLDINAIPDPQPPAN